MPKALLCKFYHKFSPRHNFKYVQNYHYLLSGEQDKVAVKVKLKKETAAFTRYAGWGLQAVTNIPKGYTLGYFVVKDSNAASPAEGTYSIRIRNKQYLVTDPESLMNKINTIVCKKDRDRWCICKIQNPTNQDLYKQKALSIYKHWLDLPTEEYLQ